MESEKFKIAIVKLSAMGDIIHAMVALQFIKKQMPNIQIDWIVEERFRGVLEHNPHIDNILTLNLKSIKKKFANIFKEFKKIKEYSKNEYDLIIDAQGLIKSALVSKLLGGKKTTGFDKDSIREKIASCFYDKKVGISYGANTIDRNVKVICEPLGIEVSSEDIVNKERFLFFDTSSTHQKTDTPYILFVIGSTWESRNYPKEKFVKIAQAIKQKTIVIWGNEKEYKKAVWMSKQSDLIKVADKGDLNDLKLEIQNSKLVIGNDTGPTHMAWALNVPSITIFGPTPTSRVYQTAINKTIKSNSFVDPHKLNKNDFSIREIDEMEIVKIAKELLGIKN